MAEAEGAEYDVVCSLYPFKERQKAVGGGGDGGRRWVVGGGGGRMVLYPHCILTVSPLYPHCILTVSLQREVSAESWVGERWRVVGGDGGGRG